MNALSLTALEKSWYASLATWTFETFSIFKKTCLYATRMLLVAIQNRKKKATFIAERRRGLIKQLIESGGSHR